jgi:hypothetical protein
MKNREHCPARKLNEIYLKDIGKSSWQRVKEGIAITQMKGLLGGWLGRRVIFNIRFGSDGWRWKFPCLFDIGHQSSFEES